MTTKTSAPTQEKSSAVRSLEKEQKRQEGKNSELKEGLKDTFPASDPVSPTSTTTTGSPREKKG